MAHLLGLDRVSYQVASTQLFADLTLGLADGDRIGVLGRNGAGKTTLLRLITGQLRPDSGRVTRASGVQIAHLRQTDSSGDTSVGEIIHPHVEKHQWARDWRIRDIHAGLLADIDLAAPVSQLSGGQRRRVSLAAQLVVPADILVLDEPTNHLDLAGVRWLAGHLHDRFATKRGALVVVTHDRWFLDAVCERIWDVVPAPTRATGAGRVETYEGGYGAYVLARAERERLRQQAAAQRNNLLRKELAWLRRGAPARTAKPKFRLEAAQALIANEPPPRDEVKLEKMATARLGKDVIDLESVSYTHPGGSQPILRDITWRLAPGARYGILGGNGAGKTTLLRLLAGELEATTGRIKRGKTVALAKLGQDSRELDALGERRVIEAVNDIATHIAIGTKTLSASQLVERLGFSHQRAYTPVRDLSGGERRRVQFLRLMMAEPNVLLLDEPTNDLDVDVLTAIEDLLDSWPGTLVVVSHDRYLLERLTTRQLAVLPGGQLRDLPGGVDAYLELQASYKPTQPQRAERVEPSRAARQREARKTRQRLERQLEKLEAEIAEVEADLAALASGEDLAELHRRAHDHDTLITQRERIETAWLQAAEAEE